MKQNEHGNWFDVSINDMLGRTFKNVTNSEEKLIFMDEKGIFIFHHWQECCEEVVIESIVGDLQDLVGSPLLLAEESTKESEDPEQCQNQTWTFYKFATIKGYVDVRWIGESNGYYSESVDLDYEGR